MTKPNLTYAESGVNYDALDPFKRACQVAAASTAGNIARLGLTEVTASRGESAYLMEGPDYYLAHVEEGLGTKNLVADAMQQLTGEYYYDRIAQDTVAATVNDIITLGALPLSVAMHAGVGDSSWFQDKQRAAGLVAGWKRACDMARCVWGGGETPGLSGLRQRHKSKCSACRICIKTGSANAAEPKAAGACGGCHDAHDENKGDQAAAAF